MQEMYDFPYIFTTNTQHNGFLFAPSEWNGMLPSNAEQKNVLLGGKKTEMHVVPEIAIIPIATDLKYWFMPAEDKENILLSRAINGIKIQSATTNIDFASMPGRTRSQMNIVGALLADNGDLFVCRLIGSAKRQSQNLQAIMRNLRFNLSNRLLPDNQLAVLQLYIGDEPETVTAVNSTESSLVFPIKARPFNVETDLFNPEKTEKIDAIKKSVVSFYQVLIDESRKIEIKHQEQLENTSLAT